MLAAFIAIESSQVLLFFLSPSEGQNFRQFRAWEEITRITS